MIDQAACLAIACAACAVAVLMTWLVLSGVCEDDNDE